MKYFIDTEFIEGFHKPLFGKRRHHIDLISIGIISEDGREYYAVSNEYNFNDASDWVKENVITPIYRQQITGFKEQFVDLKTFHKYIPDGKTNDEIRSELYNFISCPVGDTVDFYGYYSDYDWVLFCSLFGTMIDLPKGFPMYCIDLKQTFDEKVREIYKKQPTGNTALDILACYEKTGTFIFSDGPLSIENISNSLKASQKYPKQINEHNALADAKWNYELHKFLQLI